MSIVLPAAVLDVCTPWPKPGFASGFGPLHVPPLLVEQSTATSFGCAPVKPHVPSFANEG